MKESISTLPADVMRSLSTKLLAADVKNTKCASSLFVVSAPAIPLICATYLSFHCQFIFARVSPALPLLTLKFICLAASFGVLKPTPISPPTTNLCAGLVSLIPILPSDVMRTLSLPPVSAVIVSAAGNLNAVLVLSLIHY